MRGFFDPGRDDDTLPPLLVCFSPTRWTDERQRLPKMMTRAAATRQVIFMEEPVYAPDEPFARLEITHFDDGIAVAVPYLPAHTPPDSSLRLRRQMLDTLLARSADRVLILWYTDPAALGYTRHLDADLTIYDCESETSTEPEGRELLSRADVVFTDTMQGDPGDAVIDKIWLARNAQIDQRLAASAIAFSEEETKRKASSVPSPGSDAVM